jgi:acetate kinase
VTQLVMGTRSGDLDPACNDAQALDARTVSADGSDVAVLVLHTDEEWEIARQALAVVRGSV